jgi:hypothetical protein
MFPLLGDKSEKVNSRRDELNRKGPAYYHPGSSQGDSNYKGSEKALENPEIQYSSLPNVVSGGVRLSPATKKACLLERMNFRSMCTREYLGPF